jgi:hypothetical protein
VEVFSLLCFPPSQCFYCNKLPRVVASTSQHHPFSFILFFKRLHTHFQGCIYSHLCNCFVQLWMHLRISLHIRHDARVCWCPAWHHGYITAPVCYLDICCTKSLPLLWQHMLSCASCWIINVR